MSLVSAFIVWAMRRSSYRIRVITASGDFSFYRFEFLWPDEYITHRGHFDRPPWWRPFNVLLHCWKPEHDGEEMHDHPRWSITICLRGELTERTPWSERVLRPGSIVIRSRKAIHAFRVAPEFRGRTWTLFIVGRRNHQQNRYVIEPQKP